VPVAEVGDSDRGDHRDRLRGERLVVERPGATRIHQEVEHADVDDEGDAAHHAELHQLPDEVVELVVEGESAPHHSHETRIGVE
jgi:hypothetical protein